MSELRLSEQLKELEELSQEGSDQLEDSELKSQDELEELEKSQELDEELELEGMGSQELLELELEELEGQGGTGWTSPWQMGR